MFEFGRHKSRSKSLGEKLSSPFFVTLGGHTFGRSFAEDICFAASGAGRVAAEFAVNFLVGGKVPVFFANLASHRGESCIKLYLVVLLKYFSIFLGLDLMLDLMDLIFVLINE
jgi:hypothetical protein